mgnify:CR=1 FL=1
MPADSPYDQFKDLYLQAWRARLKGLATYRPKHKVVDVDAAGNTLKFEFNDDLKADVLKEFGGAQFSTFKPAAMHQASVNTLLDQVIVWGRAMRDYVGNVLPALGVSGVQVSTWSAWARSMVLRHFPDLPVRGLHCRSWLLDPQLLETVAPALSPYTAVVDR